MTIQQLNPKALIHLAGQWYIDRICRSEYEAQKFSHHNERPVEYRFALHALAETRPRNVLDVGSGTTAWPRVLRDCGFEVMAVDNVRDYWPSGMTNRHWPVLDIDIARSNGLRDFAAITCISVLEHIADHLQAVRNMASALAPGGILILTTPYSHHHPDPNVYLRADALYGKDVPYICRSSSATELQRWLDCGFDLVRRELWRMFTGPVWATGQRCDWSPAAENEPHQLGCFLLRRH